MIVCVETGKKNPANTGTGIFYFLIFFIYIDYTKFKHADQHNIQLIYSIFKLV